MGKLYEMPEVAVTISSEDEFNEWNKLRNDTGWDSDIGNWKRYRGRAIIASNPPYYLGEDSDENEYITLNELKRRLGMWKEGDVIVNCSDGRKRERTILGVCGKIVFITEKSSNKADVYNYTQKELEQEGYRLKQQTKTVELTLDQIAELKGCDVKNLKIID